jgi:NAD-dependent deacetylase
MTQEAIAELTKAVKSTHPGQILVVTGAGVSHASGIPTFRGTDKDAVWKRDVMELGTYQFFTENPAGSWQWYLSRFDNLVGKKPNPGHQAIVALERYKTERGGDFLLVTQNVDTLHEQAGSKRMIKVHGSSDRYRCSKDGCRLGAQDGSIPASEVDLRAFRQDPVEANVPRCPACGSFLRMHVLWFDEYYGGHHDYQWRAVCRAAEEQAQLVIFAGTSFAVGVTALVLRFASARLVPMFNIDPNPAIHEERVQNIAVGAEVALVEVCKELGVSL